MTKLMSDRLHDLIADGLCLEFGCAEDGSVMAVRIVGVHEDTGEYDVTMKFMGHGVLNCDDLEDALKTAGFGCQGVMQDREFTEYHYSR